MKSYKYWDRETRQAAMILKRCEICYRLTQGGCRFCPDHKKEVDKHYENFKIAAHEKAVNLTKLHYRGEQALIKETTDPIIQLCNQDIKKKNQSLKDQAAKIGDKLIGKKNG